MFAAMLMEQNSFASILDKKNQPDAPGVEVMEIMEDLTHHGFNMTPVILTPAKLGFVVYPNVNVIEE